MSEKQNHFKSTKIKIEKSYYLWGLVTEKKDIEVDKIFEKRGLTAVSSLQIRETAVFKKLAWAILSLGLYYPQTYVLKAKATQ